MDSVRPKSTIATCPPGFHHKTGTKLTTPFASPEQPQIGSVTTTNMACNKSLTSRNRLAFACVNLQLEGNGGVVSLYVMCEALIICCTEQAWVT